MTKHLCIKKEDGLYINGAKCTDGFIEGGEYEDGKDFKVEYLYSEYSGDTLMPNDDGDYAILLPALKEDSGEEEQPTVYQVYQEAQRKAALHKMIYPTSIPFDYRKGFEECFEWILNNYTITKK